MRSVAAGLNYAATRGLIHRDIKPSNILRTPAGQIKIIDLGLALQNEFEDERVTREGTTVGTVDYMAPEQARDSRATSIQSDIYSLGCTLYYFLSGVPPFPGGDITDKLTRHAKSPVPNVCDLRAGSSGEHRRAHRENDGEKTGGSVPILRRPDRRARRRRRRSGWTMRRRSLWFHSMTKSVMTHQALPPIHGPALRVESMPLTGPTPEIIRSSHSPSSRVSWTSNQANDQSRRSPMVEPAIADPAAGAQRRRRDFSGRTPTSVSSRLQRHRSQRAQRLYGSSPVRSSVLP